MKMPPILTAACAALAIFLPAVSSAQELPDNILTAEMRDGWRTESGSQMTALHLTLAPGWKTYWRAPGEAGIPPQFDWSGSTNVAGASIHWPIPELVELNGMRFAAYSDELVLPVELQPVEADKPVAVSLHVDLGVCKEVCVPMSLDLAADIDRSGASDPLIRAALASAPEPARAAGLSAARCTSEPLRDGLRLTSRLTMPEIGPDEFAIIELADHSIWVSQADTNRDGAELRAVADLVPPNAQPFALDRSSVRITVFGGSGRVVEHQGCTG